MFLQYRSSKLDLSFNEKFDAEILDLKEQYNIPAIGIAIVNNNEIEYQKSFGLMDVENEIEYNNDTPIRVQSISKSITSLATIKLIEQYNLSIDKPISEFLDMTLFERFQPEIDQVTIEALLTHQSGLTLGDIFAMYAPSTEIPSLEESLLQTIEFNSSKDFYYSNTGYNLLEWVIESVSDMTFESFVRKEVLEPLFMVNSTFDYQSLDVKHNIAGYNIKSKPVSMYVYPEKASGELFSTLTDMSRFINYLSMIDDSDDLQLNSSLKSQMFTKKSNDIGIYNYVYDGYGYGFYIESLDNDKYAVAHGGQGAGIMSHFHVLPDEQSGIVILTNSQRSWPMIAHVLSMYSRSYGFKPIKMEALIYVEGASFAFLGCLLGVLILNIKDLIVMIKHKKVTSSWTKSLISLIGVGLIIWSLNQDYLLITSILPISGHALLLTILLICGSYLLRPIIQYSKN